MLIGFLYGKNNCKNKSLYLIENESYRFHFQSTQSTLSSILVDVYINQVIYVV